MELGAQTLEPLVARVLVRRQRAKRNARVVGLALELVERVFTVYSMTLVAGVTHTASTVWQPEG